jgi:hypothetical protein
MRLQFGDFNNWNPKEGTLNKLKQVHLKASLVLTRMLPYEFKYVIDGAL